MSGPRLAHIPTVTLAGAPLAALLLAFGCASKPGNGTLQLDGGQLDGGQVEGGQLDGGQLDGDAEARSERAPGCPDTLPQAGTQCTPVTPPSGHGYWPCEYGDNPHCTSIASCGSADGHTFFWTVQPPDPSCSGNPSGCPAQFDAGAGGVCPVQGSCTYPEGRCTCGLCYRGGVCGNHCGPTIDAGPSDAGSSTATEWQCEPWPSGPGCPQPRPLLGTACTTEGQTCGTFACYCDPVDVDPGMQCTDGYWGIIPGGC